MLLRNRPARTWTLEKATGILRICVSVGRLGSAGRFCSRSHLGSLMHLLPDAARGCNRRTAGPLSTPRVVSGPLPAPRPARGPAEQRGVASRELPAAHRVRPGELSRPSECAGMTFDRDLILNAAPAPPTRPGPATQPGTGAARPASSPPASARTPSCPEHLGQISICTFLVEALRLFFSPPRIAFFFFFSYIPVVLKPESTLP